MNQSADDSEHPVLKRINPLSVMRDDENVVCEVNRHPFGMIAVYATGGGLILLIAALSFVLVKTATTTLVIAAIAAFLILGFLFLASKIYWDNYWIVTDDSLTQVTRTSLFDKEACQLSFKDLEDISAQQDGVWAHLFHFGVISAETAAATDKFILTFCPNPTSYAQKILAAREKYEHGNRSPSRSAAPNNSSGVDSYEVPLDDQNEG